MSRITLYVNQLQPEENQCGVAFEIQYSETYLKAALAAGEITTAQVAACMAKGVTAVGKILADFEEGH